MNMSIEHYNSISEKVKNNLKKKKQTQITIYFNTFLINIIDCIYATLKY